MPTNLLHHGSQNRIQKTSRNMAARKGPRLYHAEGTPTFETSRLTWGRVQDVVKRPSMQPSQPSRAQPLLRQHTIHPSLLRATPLLWYVLIQFPNAIDTTSKRWRSKRAFNTSPFHIFLLADSFSHPVSN